MAAERPGNHEPNSVGDVGGVVADAFEVAADEGDLNGALQASLVVDPTGEDDPVELLLEFVHDVIHVGKSSGSAEVALGEGLDGEAQLRPRLFAHSVDDPADPWVELNGIEPAREVAMVVRADAEKIVEVADVMEQQLAEFWKRAADG